MSPKLALKDATRAAVTSRKEVLSQYNMKQEFRMSSIFVCLGFSIISSKVTFSFLVSDFQLSEQGLDGEG
jgi:hypothetical protein